MQLDMFGATDSSATLDIAPPVVSRNGAWSSPESVAFNAALKRGSVRDAVAILNRMKADAVLQVLLASGFAVGGSRKRDEIIASVQADVLAAAQKQITGMELRAWREKVAIDGAVPQPVINPPIKQRITSELAGKMSRGMRVVDGAGKEYAAFNATYDYLEVHPIGPDGRAQVFAGNSIRFDLTENAGKSAPPNIYPPRRFEPIYLVEPLEVALSQENDHTASNNALISDELKRQGNDGRTDQSEEIPALDGEQHRGNGGNGDFDRQPLDDGLAGSGKEVDRGELPAGVSGNASQSGEGNPGERSEPAPSVATRDSGTVRDQGFAARTGGLAEAVTESLSPATPAEDYVLTEEDRIGLGSLAEKFNDNLQAIRIVRTLDAEKRSATPDERRALARYVGWGGLKGVFDPQNKQWARQHTALRALLNDAEWAAASRSQLDAFYTAPVVAKAMFSAVSRLGFVQGRIIDPSVGVGNFFGSMPIPMRNGSRLHGVELDILTSQIASALYPRAKIAKATGFEDYKVPAGYFDLVIGNPPFGSQSIVDDSGAAYSGWSIHNYFFAKSIELLRPGGIKSMVVTHNFLDKLDPHVRQWIARRAELISAVRLPNTAFKENANTEVVTDILVLRRLDNENMLGKDELPDWLDTTDIQLENSQTGETVSLSVNNYFLKHPENVLGTHSATGSMYRANEYTVLPNGDLEEQLSQWVATLPQGVYVPLERPAEELKTAAVVVPEFVKEGSYYLQDGSIWVRLADQLGEQRAQKWEAPNQRAFERMAGMIEIRDVLRAQMRLERSAASTETEIEEGRAKLNKLYDSFQKKYGFLNDPTNRRLFMDDTESALVQALEFDYEKAVTPAKAEEYGIDPRPARAVKADIFSRRVLFPPVELEVVETAKDALLHSLNMYGRVNMDYMERAYGRDEKTIVEELGDLLYVDPIDGLVTADQYLSGDVKTKLAEAKKAAEMDAAFSRNVDALTAIIPKDKLPSEIHAAIGASWIPPNIFAEFTREISGGDSSYHYVKATGQWIISEKSGTNFAKNNSEFGTEKMGATAILACLMNSRAPEVKKRVTIDGHDRYVTDEEATEAVRQRADKIRTHWDSWLWSSGERADLLTSLYNDRFNRTVERRYDGSHLTFPGMSPLITLLQHQKNGVWRGLQDRTMLMDQVVGAGKTFETIAMVMEMRRLGITKKMMIGVPNHLTLQWRSDFYRLYPGANVLAATPQDFDKENRERFFSKIVTGNWDAVIVGHSSLKKIEVPLEAEVKIVEEQFNDITDAIEDLKRERGDRNVVRDMEKIKANLEAKLKRMKEKGGEKDKVVDFGDLGVDGLAIDELHEFKNLFFTTQMQRVSGLGNPAGSGKAFDLFVKIRWLRETYGPNAPLITATGTPVSNSLAEMFTMQRYMQYEKLKEDGLHVFDAWAKQYGDVQNVYEVAPSGTGYRLSQRFAKFKNLASLMGAYRSFADVITLDDLKAQEKAQGKTFPVPKLAGGRPLNIVAKRSELQEKFFGVPEIVRNKEGAIQFEVDLSLPTQIVQRDDGKFVLEQMHGDFPRLSHVAETREETAYLAALSAITPKMTIDPKSIVGQFENLRELTRKSNGKINALSLTGLANKAGLDYRLIDPNAPDFPDSKINQAIRNMLATAAEWEGDKGVQLVFCDLSVPLSAKAKMASKDKRIYVRDDAGEITHKRGTLHTIKDYEGLPYYLVAVGKGNEKTFSMYDPVTGQLMKEGFDSKQAAHNFVAQFVARDGGQERWLDMREQSPAISPEEIDEYKNEQAIETDAESADLEITAQDIEGVTGTTGFSVYDDMKAKLIAGGIPASQIEFIHDHDTPQAKDALFKRVNAGDVRFLFGSTPKMGAGTNVQKRLVALHHIDAPWRPSDLEQREGRIIRRGNLLYERDPEGFMVKVNRYATSQTYDTRRWQLLEHKAAGLEQLRHYDGANEIDDVANEAANSADMKAAASGNPLILKETQLATQVKKLRLLERAHRDSEYMTRSRMQGARHYAEVLGPQAIRELQAIQAQRDTATALAVYNGRTLSDHESLIPALDRIAFNLTANEEGKEVLVYRGAKFTFSKIMAGFGIDWPDGYGTSMDKFSSSGVVTRMDNWLESIEGKIATLESRIAAREMEAENMASVLGKPFDQHDELLAAIEEHGKVQRALMKANALSAVKPEEMREFNAAVIEQKNLLRDHGFGAAVDEIEREAAESAVSLDEPTADQSMQRQDFEHENDRRNHAQRDIFTKNIEDITDPEELKAYITSLRTQLLTSERAGLGSNRAWMLRDPKPYVASIDLDSLKWVNDHMGHSAGDQMIAAAGEAFRKAGLGNQAYHISGDEFYAQADSEIELAAALEAARNALSTSIIRGEGITFQGPSFSFGIANNFESAERKLHEDKRSREDSGLRAARGEQPRGIVQADRAHPDISRSEGNRSQAARNGKDEEVTPVTGNIFSQSAEQQTQADTRQSWEQTLAEFTTAKLAASEYREAIEEDADARKMFDANAEREWHKALNERAKVGRVSDAALDDLVSRHNIQFVQSMFRGVNEKGAEGYFTPEICPEVVLHEGAAADNNQPLASKKPVTPQIPGGDMERFIKVAADSIQKLRKVDVYRVLVESNRAEYRLAIATYIREKRPDLVEEVDSVLEEERAQESGKVSMPRNEPTALASLAKPDDEIVREGIFVGRVLSVENGVVTQKVNRAGDTVLHSAALLSGSVNVGDVVNIQYCDGRGSIEGGKANEMER
ncbi:MAG TPA: diguanylate cyclase [Noviherbaspirillum sp.]|nr:diguanylate cyclase [Noviherbaspirillum sp.]